MAQINFYIIYQIQPGWGCIVPYTEEKAQALSEALVRHITVSGETIAAGIEAGLPWVQAGCSAFTEAKITEPVVVDGTPVPGHHGITDEEMTDRYNAAQWQRAHIG